MYFRDKMKQLKLRNVDSIEIIYRGYHFEIKVNDKVIKYFNMKTPWYIRTELLQGYFDEKTTVIRSEDMEKIEALFDNMVQKLPLKNELNILPIGIRYHAYMRIKMDGLILYYTDTYVSNDDFRLNIEMVAEEFVHIVQIMDAYCDFPRYINDELSKVFSETEYEVLNHITQDVAGTDFSRIIGIRENFTFSFGYYFHNGRSEMCWSMCKVQNPLSLHIKGLNQSWTSEIKESYRVSKGCTRYVYNDQTSAIVAKIVCMDMGKFVINDSVTVYCIDEVYAFYCDEQVIAKIKRIQEQDSDSFEYSRYFEVMVCNNIVDDLLLLILSFPMLRFI